ncbi:MULTISPECIES: cyclophilin-like fold protein [Bacillus]|uniref:cyclophilin-like fold protein n=1 Tax=Bacillus TaxID=1386 RepID=UPI00273C2372|nr:MULTISPECIES: cyclophilin-like fold protein [Bacillus]MDP4527372.1 cyclophilin-like fold protein [Bacillus halotolerans]MDY7430582.1 cyclophilin-like fold protein [Bacillus sp. V26]
MKKLLGLALILVMSFALAACSSNDNNLSETDRGHIATDNSNRAQEGPTEDSISNIRIKLTFNQEEVIIRMYDNPTSRDFLERLPLTLTFEDYAGTEKISYPSNKLSTEEASSGIDPTVGDFTYYAPWGNLAIYYKDFGYSKGLIKLGKIESGVEKLQGINSDFTVTIEQVD